MLLLPAPAIKARVVQFDPSVLRSTSNPRLLYSEEVVQRRVTFLPLGEAERLSNVTGNVAQSRDVTFRVCNEPEFVHPFASVIDWRLNEFVFWAKSTSTK